MILSIFTDIGNWVQKIWATLSSIGNTIEDVCGFVLDFFKELGSIIDYISKAATFLFDCLSDMPSIFLGFATATIFVLILYQIVGRSGGAE